MRSMFTSAPFSRYDLGNHVLGRGLGLPRLALGQVPAQSAYALEDYAERIEGLTEGETKTKLRAQYKECLEKDGTSQIACFAVLGAQVYQAVKDEGDSSSAPRLPIAPPRPVDSGIPYLPIGLAVLGAGALIYFLATQGK